MLTITMVAFLFATQAQANDSARNLIKASEETALINHRKDIETTKTFYHFTNVDRIEIKKESEPMIICKYENKKLDCKNNLVQLIDMPMLSFWSLKSI